LSGTPSDLDSALIEGVPPDELARYLEWRERIRGTNISEKTLLATDYLNHLNEIVMLLEMLPDMPMMLDDCYQWQPKTYQEHFRDSGFSDRELAIAAYEHVPTKFRRPFEDVLEQMSAVTAYTIQKLADAIDKNDEQRLRLDAESLTGVIHRIIQTANGIIHGTTEVMAQEEIDRFLTDL